VLESHVPEAVRAAMPELGDAADQIHVFPHPITSSPLLGHAPPRPPSRPLRIGLPGKVTRDKGIDEFARLAHRFDGRSEVRFEVNGWLPPNAPDLEVDLSHLDVPPSPTPLSFDRYVDALSSLDYVCLPLGGAYYDFAASGTLLDAVAGLTPVLTLDTPIARGMFREAGDIGYVCENEDELTRVVEKLAAGVDPVRHARQVECLHAFRASRAPAALAYRLAPNWLRR